MAKIEPWDDERYTRLNKAFEESLMMLKSSSARARDLKEKWADLVENNIARVPPELKADYVELLVEDAAFDMYKWVEDFVIKGHTLTVSTVSGKKHVYANSNISNRGKSLSTLMIVFDEIEKLTLSQPSTKLKKTLMMVKQLWR